MKKYFIKRFLLFISNGSWNYVCCFIISHMAPAIPFESELVKWRGQQVKQEEVKKQISAEEIPVIKEQLHLDKPTPIALPLLVKNIVQFDLGNHE